MPTRAVSKMTSKNQTTVPAPIREALSLERGDSLLFEIGEDGAVTVRKVVALDQPFTAALETALPEWESSEDDEAYREL